MVQKGLAVFHKRLRIHHLLSLCIFTLIRRRKEGRMSHRR
jgi:hypothetical protein